jgi:ABC-type proline/glycine betaine transport system substrate-binding protein
LPATTQAVLRKVRFDITDTTAMDHAVNVDGLSTLQAARQWMDSYPEKVRAWLG